jgi:integrase
MGVRRDKTRNNRWYYEFWIGDERFRGYPKKQNGEHVTLKSEAQEAESAARKQARAQQGAAKNGIKPGTYSLALALDRHISKCETDGGSASHLTSLNRIAIEMLAHFGENRAVVDINADDVEGYRKFLVAQKRKVWIGGPRKPTPADLELPQREKVWKELDRLRSPSEVNHCLDLLRCALQGVHKMQDPRTGQSMLPFPPTVEPVFEPERDPTPMSPAEFRARLKGAPSWVIDAANLAWWFGLRLTEALTLEVRHLDYENECLRLLASETKSGKDQAVYGGREGWIVVRWLERKALRRGQRRLVMWPGKFWYKAERRGERIPNDAWQPLKSIRRAWMDTIDRAGIENPHRFHDMRAAYITNAARLGSSKITKGLARHASMATTERYIKIVENELAEAAKRAARSRPRLRVVKR